MNLRCLVISASLEEMTAQSFKVPVDTTSICTASIAGETSKPIWLGTVKLDALTVENYGLKLRNDIDMNKMA